MLTRQLPASLPQEQHRRDVVRALQANRRLQSRLRQVLESLGHAVLANAEQQARLQRSHSRRGGQQLLPRMGRYPGMHDVVDVKEQRGRLSAKAIGPSRFFVVDRQVPEPNADSVRLAEAYRFLPHAFPAREWSEADRDALRATLLNIIQEERFQREFDELHARQAAGEELAVPALDAANAAVADLTLESPGVAAEVSAFSAEQWERAASIRLLGRSGAECAAQWAHRLRPGTNLGAWTPDEDARLLRLAELHKRADWPRIAAELGTGRPAVDCLARFQRELNPELLRRPWTHEEEGRLADAVAKHGRDWAAVAAEVGGRNAQQVKHHFLYAQNVNLRKGPWTKEEDAALLKAVAVHGPKKWAAIAPAVPHRSDQQCRERWLNVLDPSLRFCVWEPSEDAALREAVAACTKPNGKTGWTAVSRRVPGRTDSMVR
ncbi:hypothetical protein WJX81_005627 [Elliptochloris bilobata]|uniref:Uncharacterized protein n=1 Tax=Elliptochloris bilobata TaxID=381761 RepID=A0AAW1SLX4_9CHLO